MMDWIAATTGMLVAAIGARVAWIRMSRWFRRKGAWQRRLRAWWDDPLFDRARGQWYHSYIESVSDSDYVLIETLESTRRAFVSPDIARYLSTFWNDPKVDPAALQAEIDHYFPLLQPRAMTWMEWVSWTWFPASRFARIVRNERFLHDRTCVWRTRAMTPTRGQVDWNENILDVYRIPPDADLTQVANYETLQIHLSTMTALKDYYGNYSSFTDQHRWASRKLNTWIALQANVHGDPVGNVTVWYDPLRRCFCYRGQLRHCQHFHNNALIAMGIRYVLQFRCRDFFIDDRWFPNLCKGYRNDCRLYKDDTVTMVDVCLQVAGHLCITDGALTLAPHRGNIQPTLAMLTDDPSRPPPPLLHDRYEEDPSPDGAQALVDRPQATGEVVAYQRAPTPAEVLYDRGYCKQYMQVIPKDLHKYCVGRAYRPLPREATMTTEDRIVAYDQYHQSIQSDTERRLQDYELVRGPAPAYAASSHTQSKAAKTLGGGRLKLCNQFERVELQAGQYEEFPVITNPLAIGWRTHDPVSVQNLHRLALTDVETGKSKTLGVLRDALAEIRLELKEAAVEAPPPPSGSWFEQRYDALEDEEDDEEANPDVRT